MSNFMVSGSDEALLIIITVLVTSKTTYISNKMYA